MNIITPDFSTRNAARAYIKMGLRPIPIPLGQKGPNFKNWNRLQIEYDHVDSWFFDRENIGILCGVGGNSLVTIDLDDPYAVELAPEFLPKTGCIVGHPGSPGSHFVYRCPEASKLPSKSFRLQVKNQFFGSPVPNGQPPHPEIITATIIDVLADGKQVLVGPSVHPKGDPYDPLIGDIATIDYPELVEAVESLFEAVKVRYSAEGFDLVNPIKTYSEGPLGTKDSSQGLRPGDAFNQSDEIRSVIEREFGPAVSSPGNNQLFRRHGKTEGCSATLGNGKNGKLYFYVFTSSTRLSPGAYSPFAAYAFLLHNGDFSAAAKDLSAKGWGTKIEKTQNVNGFSSGQVGSSETKFQPPPTRGISINGTAIGPMKPVKFLWRNFVPRGVFGTLDGYPGSGKSQSLGDLAAGITSGFVNSTIPGGEPSEPQTVAWFTCEETKEKVAARIKACGGDLSRLEIVEAFDVNLPNGEVTKRFFSMPTDFGPLEQLLKEKRPALVVLDSQDGLISSTHKTIDAQKTREILNQLVLFADQYGATFILIRHFSKSSMQRSGPALTKGSGSMSFAGAARFVLTCDHHPADVIRIQQQKAEGQSFSVWDGSASREEPRSVLFCAKANDFKDGCSAVFRKRVVSWECPNETEPVQLSVPEWEGLTWDLTDNDFDPFYSRGIALKTGKRSRGPLPEVREECIAAIREALLMAPDRRLPGNELSDLMVKQDGFSQATFKRARGAMKELGEIERIVDYTENGKPISMWKLTCDIQRGTSFDDTGGSLPF